MIEEAHKEAAKVKEDIINEATRKEKKLRKNTKRGAVKEAEKLFSQLTRRNSRDMLKTVVVKILNTQITPEVQINSLTDY